MFIHTMLILSVNFVDMTLVKNSNFDIAPNLLQTVLTKCYKWVQWMSTPFIFHRTWWNVPELIV